MKCDNCSKRVRKCSTCPMKAKAKPKAKTKTAPKKAGYKPKAKPKAKKMGIAKGY